MKILRIIGLVMLMLSLIVVACGNQVNQNPDSNSDVNGNTNDRATNTTQLTIATGNTGSAIYALGGALGQIIENHVPGVKTTIVSSAGYGENAVLLATKQADIGTTSGRIAKAAFKEKPELYDTLVYIATAHQNFQHIVVLANSGINSISDLKGKRVSVGEPGSGTEQVSKHLLQVYGMTYDDIKVEFLSFNESIDALQNGRLDAVLITTLLPNPAIMSLATQKDIRLLPMTKEEVDKLNELYPGFVFSKIPAGTYKGQDKDIYTAASPASYVVHKDMPEELVYQITKTFIEYAEEAAKIHPAASQWTIENALLGVDFPYHPGAVKYYKEIGAWENRAEGVREFVNK